MNGFAGPVRAKINWALAGGNAQQRRAAQDALRNAAGAAGYRTGPLDTNNNPTVSDTDVSNWLSDQSFTQQRATGQNAINNAGVAGVTLRLSYPTPDPPGTL